MKAKRYKTKWAMYHDLGSKVAKHLPKNESFVDIGRAFNMSRQHARGQCMAALGKVVYAMRRAFKNEG